MSLPENIRDTIATALQNFCDVRVPPEVRHKVRLAFTIERNTVTLLEERPYFQDPSRWTKSPIARFRFFSGRQQWALYYRDRNGRWHKYPYARPKKNFDTLMGEVDKDTTGIFWG